MQRVPAEVGKDGAAGTLEPAAPDLGLGDDVGEGLARGEDRRQRDQREHEKGDPVSARRSVGHAYLTSSSNVP